MFICLFIYNNFICKSIKSVHHRKGAAREELIPVAFQTKFPQIMYTYKSHVDNINFITKKPFQVVLTKEAFLSALMKQQGTFQLLCMLNGTHMRPYKYCLNSEFHHVNWSRGSRHEFLERWWLLVHVAYNWNNTRLFVLKVMNSPQQTCSKQILA